MAISKERLEELIEKEETIWAVYDTDRIEKIKLVVRMFGVSVEEYNKLHDCEPMLYSRFYGIFKDICPISWLFETKSEAEEFAEFGNITRMEKLELPSWKEFNKGKFYFFNSKDCRYDLSPDLIHDEIVLYENVYGGGYFIYNKWKLTRENYTLARRLCVKLFRGESV